jgi:hypothetical protein
MLVEERELGTDDLSFSMSTNATCPLLVATAHNVLLNGLHPTATISPPMLVSIVIALVGPEGLVMSYITNMRPTPRRSRVRV